MRRAQERAVQYGVWEVAWSLGIKSEGFFFFFFFFFLEGNQSNDHESGMYGIQSAVVLRVDRHRNGEGNPTS